MKQTRTEREEREALRYVKKVGLTSRLTVFFFKKKNTNQLVNNLRLPKVYPTLLGVMRAKMYKLSNVFTGGMEQEV